MEIEYIKTCRHCGARKHFEDWCEDCEANTESLTVLADQYLEDEQAAHELTWEGW